MLKTYGGRVINTKKQFIQCYTNGFNGEMVKWRSINSYGSLFAINSNGYITVSTACTIAISFKVMWFGVGESACRIHKNGSAVQNGASTKNGYTNNTTARFVVTCNAGDYITLGINVAGVDTYQAQSTYITIEEV